MKKTINRGDYKSVPQTIGSSKGNTVYLRMTANSIFAAFKPEIDELKVRRDAYELADANAADGGKLLTAAKNKAYDLFIDQMDAVADKVEELANGDTDIATAAGFVAIKEAKSISDLSIPKGFAVVNAERSSDVKAKWKTEPNVSTYAIEYQIQGETVWQNGTFSNNGRGTIVSGLPAGAIVLFRIQAIGRKGIKSEWSEPISLRIL